MSSQMTTMVRREVRVTATSGSSSYRYATVIAAVPLLYLSCYRARGPYMPGRGRTVRTWRSIESNSIHFEPTIKPCEFHVPRFPRIVLPSSPTHRSSGSLCLSHIDRIRTIRCRCDRAAGRDLSIRSPSSPINPLAMWLLATVIFRALISHQG